MYELRRVTGDERFRLAARVLKNRGAFDDRLGGCAKRCGRCDPCLRAKFSLWASIASNGTVDAIDNGDGTTKGVILWVGNELHGQIFDGRLYSKRGALEGSIQTQLEDYHVVRTTVPASAKSVFKFFVKKLGFDVGYIAKQAFEQDGKLYDVAHLIRSR